MKIKTNKGITLIALIITIILHYDYLIKVRNNNGFPRASLKYRYINYKGFYRNVKSFFYGRVARGIRYNI